MILLGQLLRHFSMNFITEKDHFCIIIHDKDMTVCTSCKTLYDVLHNQVQKISIPYHGQLFRNSQGFLQLEIQRDGGILHDWNFQEMWRGGGGVLNCRSGIFQGSVNSIFLENPYFMALIRSQIKQKLTTLLTTVEAEQNIAASSFFFSLIKAAS